MLIGFFTYLGWVQMWTDAAADADAERDGFRHIPDNAMVDHHPLVRRGAAVAAILVCTVCPKLPHCFIWILVWERPLLRGNISPYVTAETLLCFGRFSLVVID